MRTKLALLLCIILSSAARVPGSYRAALPGYTYQFPRDHFSHPEFRTEWWYYTGNVRDVSNRRFGYELTFFRHSVETGKPKGVWDVKDVWMAHLALSDIEGNRFFNFERLNRAGPGLAGADADNAVVWNGNWKAQWTLDPGKQAGFGQQKLTAFAEPFSIDLSLTSGKPPVIHGKDGVSQKSAGAGRASHYVSLTHLRTKGTITLEGKPFSVEGVSWMDHEFFSGSMESNLIGWDWFSLQFEDNTELMLYRLRRKDGSVEPFSSGTWVDATGRSRHLELGDFSLVPGKTWTSAKTKGAYPVEWTLRVPALALDCTIRTRLPQQELAGKFGTSPSYWEGAIEVTGTKAGASVRAAGYLEMTGYAGAVRMGD